MEKVEFRCIVAGTILLSILARSASAQDTLSDAAWKADIAHRAALRHAAQAEADSAALLVDTIEVSTTELTVRVGDTLNIPEVVGRLRAVGKSRDGRVIATFHPRYLLPMSNAAFAIRQGQVVAIAPGEAWLRAKAKSPAGPDDDSRPTTKIRIVARP